MEYELKEKFKLTDDGKIQDLPEVMRHKIHKDLKEILPALEERAAEFDGYAGIENEEWPVKYILGNDEIVIIISIVGMDFETVESVLAFKLPKDNIDKLLE